MPLAVLFRLCPIQGAYNASEGHTMEAQLSESAVRVLQAIREKAMDGYTVLSRARVTPEELSTVLRELQGRGAVSIKGDLSPDRVGESYVSVPPNAIGYVDFLLGRVRFSSMR